MILSLLSASSGVLELCDGKYDPVCLRHLLVDELRQSPKDYNLASNKELTRDLKLMRYQGQLLYLEVLLAFSLKFRCVVLLHYGTSVPVIYAHNSYSDLSLLPRIHLQCVSRIHFNPVMESTLYKTPRCLFQSTLPLDTNVTSCESACLDNVHTVDDVDVLEEEVESTPSLDDWCIVHKPAQKMTIMTSIADRRFCLLIDTGAQISCISQKVIGDT